MAGPFAPKPLHIAMYAAERINGRIRLRFIAPDRFDTREAIRNIRGGDLLYRRPDPPATWFFEVHPGQVVPPIMYVIPIEEE